MAIDKDVKGSVEKQGEGEIQFIKLNVELDDSVSEQLVNDPHGVVQGFLESQGYVVNAVLLHDPSPDAILGGRWAHIFRPAHEASKWIQLPPIIM